MAACEDAILVVDAGQGIEAQAPANICLAVEQNLVIVLVINQQGWPASAEPKK